ncbi:MAG: hypothetical protein WDN25_11455 [Acetobacteraceae bacterium]
MKTLHVLAIAAGFAASGSAAWAQAQPAATSVGPGRIVCRSAKSCDMEIGSPVSLKYKIDYAALGDADKDRLTKQCTAKGAPCIATVTGVEGKAGVKAASIKFYN